jgi:hypothetical protein
MSEEKENKRNENQTEETRTMGQEKPGTTMEQRKMNKDTSEDDVPRRPADQTPEEQFYNDQNSDPLLAKKQ